MKASGEQEKLEQGNIDEGQSSKKKAEKEKKNLQNGVQPESQILKDILTYPKPVVRKKQGRQIFPFISLVSK